LAWAAYRFAGLWGVAAAALVVTLVGTWASAVAEKHYDEHDSSHIVVDELAGQLVSVLPVAGRWPYLVVAFGWFRLFDSVKPWPAGWVDRNVGGGVGVMLDDLAAAVYAAAVTALLVHTGLVDIVLEWFHRFI
jgi:phosphatidylglycerophosphatase A